MQKLLNTGAKVQLIDNNEVYIIGYIPNEKSGETDYIGIKDLLKLNDYSVVLNEDYFFFPQRSIECVKDFNTYPIGRITPITYVDLEKDNKADSPIVLAAREYMLENSLSENKAKK